MLSESQIRQSLMRFLRGELSLDEFEDWLVQNSWNMQADAPEAAQKLVAAIELRLAEHSSGHLDDDDLRTECRMLLIHGSQVLELPMLVFRLGHSSVASTVSSSFSEPPRIDRVVIAAHSMTSVNTRSASSRVVTAQEILHSA